jgi:tetratricopeptide (TPR) repeat protein
VQALQQQKGHAIPVTTHRFTDLWLQERYKDAERWWHHAREEVIAGFGATDAHHAVIANGLAEVNRRAGGQAFAKAEGYYRESLDITEREFGPRDVRYAQALQYLGQYLSDAGRHKEALHLLHQAVQAKRQALGRHHIDVAQV